MWPKGWNPGIQGDRISGFFSTYQRGVQNSFLVTLGVFKRYTKYQLVQAIYISLFMGVTRNCRYPTPNSYKQCAESSRQLRVKSGIRAHSVVAGKVGNEFRAWSWGKSRKLVQSSELRVRSESSMRQNDFVNCVGPDQNIVEHKNWANPNRYVNKSRYKQNFKNYQDSIIVSLTPSHDLFVTF